MVLAIDESEVARKRAVVAAILEHVRSGVAIRLPPFDRATSVASDDFALLSIGQESNDFNGAAGPYLYQFEGEDDLLHLFVIRRDGQPLSVHEGRAVTSFLLDPLPTALIWLKPGDLSQHFYVAHDDLLEYLSDPSA